MNNQTRSYLYAFLSRVYADSLDDKFLIDLKNNDDLLSMIGESTKNWFMVEDMEKIKEELNIDFSSIFLMNAKPLETSVIDSKDEILVGLQNPVMQFYFNHNYDLNLSATHLQTPDHLSVELAFMQNLIGRDEKATQAEFLKKHLLNWAAPYFIGIKEMTTTPLYSDLCDFTVEFLTSDYDYLKEELRNE